MDVRDAKQLITEHLVAAALAWGIVVSVLTVAITLAVTGSSLSIGPGADAVPADETGVTQSRRQPEISAATILDIEYRGQNWDYRTGAPLSEDNEYMERHPDLFGSTSDRRDPVEGLTEHGEGMYAEGF